MKRAKSVVIASVLVASIGGGAAVWANDDHPTTATTTTTSGLADAQKPTATTVDPNAPESVASTTTTAPPAGLSTEEIKAAQQRLSDLGYWVGSVDGKSGQSTQQALMAFQKVQGLAPSGKADSATLSALTVAVRPAPASSSGSLIEIDKKRQVIFFVADGKTQWVLNTSTGTEKAYSTNGHKGVAHTPTGSFKVMRAIDGYRTAELGVLYRPRYFTNDGIAIHGSGSIPASPASHGCARVSNAAMDFIWSNKLMEVGKTVWVYDVATPQPATTTTSTSVAPTITTAPAPTTTVAPTTTTSSVGPTT